MAKIKQIVTLREKKLSNGNVSLYLDIYFNGKRQYDFLKLYPKQKPRTPEERTQNSESYALAERIRATKESQLKYSEHGLISPTKRKIDFIDYCNAFLDNYPNTDKRIVKYAIKYFTEFIRENKGIKQLLPSDVTEDIIIEYKKFLDSKLNGESPYNYFTKFKKICKQATKDRIFLTNPAMDIVNKRKDGLKKDIISMEEILELAKTECSNIEIKRAFLLSLNTGLRFVDVDALTWGQVYKNQIIIKGQKKTGEAVYIDLNNSAKMVLGEYGNPEEKVFNLPSLTGCLKSLKVWTKKAGITKNITWHSARHSFAVILLTEGKANIKTVSSLLGHAGLKHTEKYTRVVDKLKAEAVNNLPDIQY